MKPTHFSNALKSALCIAILLMSNVIFSQSNEMSISKNHNDKDIVWNQAPEAFPGCSFTVLHGDLESPNMDFYFKVEPNTSVVNHTHNSAERMILVAGEMEVTYEGEDTVLLKEGDYAYGPAGKPHSAKCLDKGPCVLFVALVEPFNADPVKE